MSRDYRDQRGGHKNPHLFISNKRHGEFTRACRKSARAKAKNALRNGREPEPKYGVETEYFD
jgi:hypothetical protein